MQWSRDVHRKLNPKLEDLDFGRDKGEVNERLKDEASAKEKWAMEVREKGCRKGQGKRK